MFWDLPGLSRRSLQSVVSLSMPSVQVVVIRMSSCRVYMSFTSSLVRDVDMQIDEAAKRQGDKLNIPIYIDR